MPVQRLLLSVQVTVIVFLVQTSHQGQTHNNNSLLLFSTTDDIRIANVSQNGKTKTSVLISNKNKNQTYINAIDYHYDMQKICWADTRTESIQCAHFDGVEAKNTVEIVSRVPSPDGLACDWFTDKIYWTDSNYKRIEVATMQGKDRKVLYWMEIDQPRAIAVAPMHGLLFWTDWGESPKIERAGMNGAPETRRAIVTENLSWPNGLTIDYESQLIYWVDAKYRFLQQMDFNGTNLTTVISQGLDFPFALTHIGSRFYWTDWKTRAIHFYDMNTLQKPTELIDFLQDIKGLMDIHVWAKERQPKTNHPCQMNNGGCSHLCLLSPNPPGYSCACGIGIRLMDDHNCATGPQELLVLARKQDIYLIHLDSPDYTYKVLPLANVTYSIAVDYDPVEKYIYWSDDDIKKIQRAYLNGSNEQEVISLEITHPQGIAIDWISRNIYWTDAGTDRIEVVRLNSQYRKVIISDGLVEPRAIAVAPELGWIFWSDWYEKKPKIERANSDGSERTLIVAEKLGWPNGITLDLEKLKIYWCDAKENKIEYANMDGTERRTLIDTNVPHVFGLSLMGQYIYWSDWQSRHIERADKETAEKREFILDQTENVMGLKAIKLIEQQQQYNWNLCAENNGNCSQFCFHRHNKTKVCACQIDYELTADKVTCTKPQSFLLYAKKDTIGRIGIENLDNDIIIPIRGIKDASAIDVDVNTMRIYWGDRKLKTIMRAFLNGSDAQKVIDLGLESIGDLAIDCLALNIYWTDPEARRIEVSRLMGSSRRTLLWSVNKPYSIVLDPLKGHMYWSEQSMDRTTAIYQASMDGSNAKKFNDCKSQISGLTLDYTSKRLYWAETDSRAIVSCDLNNGFGRKEVIRDDKLRPIGLTMYKDLMYWSDELTGSIYKAHKKGTNTTKIHQFQDDIATDLLVYHVNNLRETNQCSISNGGCSHLCLALPQNEFTCACPTHYNLVNKTECIPPQQFMIYSQRNLAGRLVPDTKDYPAAVLPIQGLKAVKAIEYDAKDNYFYWIEGKSHSIKRIEAGMNPIHDVQMSVVVKGNQEVHAFDLAVDTIGRLLFWTCAVKNIINITRLDNSNPFGHLETATEKPRLIAIHVKKRLLFYTDVSQTGQLIRTRLDGSHKLIIVKASNIVAIAVDTDNDSIVWALENRIYISNLDGDGQHVLLNTSNSKIKQLTVHLNFLYWVDNESSHLKRLDLKSEQFRSPLEIEIRQITDLISVKKFDKDHHCLNKKCSHFCILNGTIPQCACPNGKMLQDDQKSCVVLPNCGKDAFTCASLMFKECIPIAWRCDKQSDCRDASDEEDCPPCKSNQFRCQDGLCIDSKHVCDGYDHCTDKSDELNCCKSFKCKNTNVCIDDSLVCNGMENCGDGSDEYPEVCKTSKTNTVILIVAGIVFILVLITVIMYFQRRKVKTHQNQDQSEDSLSPMHPNAHNNLKLRKVFPDVVSMVNDSLSSTYDRRHVTGASSSSNTNGSSVNCYPRETLNPPPSPATTAASTRGSSPSSRYRPYKHYRSINQPPPPTPCSTDICDESDYNYTPRRYDAAPMPPPPTPRSHCHIESCPPSPSSRSSTYFSPLPPPPSPVASPRGDYDS